MTKRSIQAPRFQAAITPKGTAMTTARMMVDSAIEYRGLDALSDHLHDREVGDQGRSEIAVQQLVHPGDELHDQRLVETERGADALQLFRGRIVAGENCGGIAGGEAEQEKHEQRDDAHHRHRGEDLANEISEQVGSVRLECNRGQRS